MSEKLTKRFQTAKPFAEIARGPKVRETDKAFPNGEAVCVQNNVSVLAFGAPKPCGAGSSYQDLQEGGDCPPRPPNDSDEFP